MSDGIQSDRFITDVQYIQLGTSQLVYHEILRHTHILSLTYTLSSHTQNKDTLDGLCRLTYSTTTRKSGGEK